MRKDDTQVYPHWIEVAEKEIGISEIAGTGNNMRIQEYHSETTLKPKYHKDSVSWCSSFVNWVMEKSGVPSTRSAAARSWMKWGYALKKPKMGCVVVFWRGSRYGWKGHVGYYMGEYQDYIAVLGGNQFDQVNITYYPKNRLLGYRWNEKVEE